MEASCLERVANNQCFTMDPQMPCESDPSCRYLRYPIMLGRGAWKRVYKAFDQQEGIEVAWNQVELAGSHLDEQHKERLFAEIRVLKQLTHKNLMSFHDWWYDAKNECINFITEYFTSGTLRQFRKKHRNISESAIKRWAYQILEGLVYLHAHDPPIVHRDLKCDNILVNGTSGVVKIADLGLASCRRGMSVVGTPEFMAPEIYDEVYDEKVDIYSFGMCMLELATLEYPYSECRSIPAIFRKVSQAIPPAGLARVPNEELRSFIQMCIRFDPTERPSALQLLKHEFFDSLRADASACSSPTMAWSIMTRSFSPVVSYSNLSGFARGHTRSSCSDSQGAPGGGGAGTPPSAPGTPTAAAPRVHSAVHGGMRRGRGKGPGRSGAGTPVVRMRGGHTYSESDDPGEGEEEEGDSECGEEGGRRARTVCIAALKNINCDGEEGRHEDEEDEDEEVICALADVLNDDEEEEEGEEGGHAVPHMSVSSSGGGAVAARNLALGMAGSGALLFAAAVRRASVGGGGGGVRSVEQLSGGLPDMVQQQQQQQQAEGQQQLEEGSLAQQAPHLASDQAGQEQQQQQPEAEGPTANAGARVVAADSPATLLSHAPSLPLRPQNCGLLQLPSGQLIPMCSVLDKIIRHRHAVSDLSAGAGSLALDMAQLLLTPAPTVAQPPAVLPAAGPCPAEAGVGSEVAGAAEAAGEEAPQGNASLQSESQTAEQQPVAQQPVTQQQQQQQRIVVASPQQMGRIVVRRKFVRFVQGALSIGERVPKRSTTM